MKRRTKERIAIASILTGMFFLGCVDNFKVLILGLALLCIGSGIAIREEFLK